MSPKEAFKRLETKNSIFLDIRDPASFKEKHIPSSINVNEIFSYLSTSDKKGISDLTNLFQESFRKAGINGNEHVITYEECLKTRYGASCRGYFLLKLLGHNNVNVLDGGWEGWIKENLPISKEEYVPKRGSFTAKWDDSIWMGKDELFGLLKDKNTTLVDVRDYEEWMSESSSPYGKDFAPRKGRIPGAIHLLWKDLMYVKDGLTYVKDKGEVLKICNEKGINPEKNIVVYCFKGARSSNTFIALKQAGFKNVKNYFASWNEWSREHSLPIENGKS
jgi:thiosulfate/3-mercaptopyruvate sulfurtransferase